jgi:hypothetical protein
MHLAPLLHAHLLLLTIHHAFLEWRGRIAEKGLQVHGGLDVQGAGRHARQTRYLSSTSSQITLHLCLQCAARLHACARPRARPARLQTWRTCALSRHLQLPAVQQLSKCNICIKCLFNSATRSCAQVPRHGRAGAISHPPCRDTSALSTFSIICSAHCQSWDLARRALWLYMLLRLRLSPALLCFVGMLSRHFNTCTPILCVWDSVWLGIMYSACRMAMDVDVHA